MAPVGEMPPPLRFSLSGKKRNVSAQPGIDLDTSKHHPGNTRIGFVVDDLKAFLESIKGKDVKVEGPMDSHLGMRIVRLTDPDGHIVEVQEFSEGTPPPVRQAFED